MTDKQHEALIRADELEAIGAESSLARAMAAHSIRLLYKENTKLHELNAELVEALRGLLHLEEETLRGSDDDDISYEMRFAHAAIAKAQGDNND